MKYCLLGPWSECDTWCGEGRQTRSVVCVIWSRGQYRVTSDTSHCKKSPRPDTSKLCSKPCHSQWFTSEWSEVANKY